MYVKKSEKLLENLKSVLGKLTARYTLDKRNIHDMYYD